MNENAAGNDATNAEVMQFDAVAVTVPVRIEGIANVRTVPSKGGGEVNSVFLIRGGTAVKLLASDPMRRSALIYSTDTDIVIGSQAGDANATVPTGALWPNKVVLPWNASTELWARVNSAVADANLTVITERWAD